VDFEEWSDYKIQLHGIEWIVSLSADWDQKKKKKPQTTAISSNQSVSTTGSDASIFNAFEK